MNLLKGQAYGWALKVRPNTDYKVKERESKRGWKLNDV